MNTTAAEVGVVTACLLTKFVVYSSAHMIPRRSLFRRNKKRLKAGLPKVEVGC